MLNAEKIEELELVRDKLTAMSDFSLEVRSFIEKLLEAEGIAPAPTSPLVEKVAPKVETKTEEAKPPKAAEKAEKVVEKEVEVEKTEQEVEISEEDIAQVIEEYGLDEMSVDELKEELEANGISIPKKPTVKSLARLVAESILSGAISTDEEGEDTPAEEEKAAEVVPEEEKVSTDEEAEEGDELTADDVNAMSLEELQELCKDNEIEVPKATLKDVKKLRACIIELLTDEEEEDEPVTVEAEAEVVEEEAFPASAERLAEEAKVADEIRAQIDKKKLTTASMKKELKKYYEGSAECKDCKGCSEEELIECYTLMKQSFVDDDGDRHKEKDPYFRNDTAFCCGVACEQHPDDANTAVCTICAEEYDMSEE